MLGLLGLLVLLAACDGPPEPRPSTCPFAYATRAAGQLTVATAPASGPGSCVLVLPDDVAVGETLPVRPGEPSRGERTAHLRVTSAEGTGDATSGTVAVAAVTPALRLSINVDGTVKLQSSVEVPIL